MSLRGDLREQRERRSFSMLIQVPALSTDSASRPNYSSTDCSGGLCDVDTDSFVDVEYRAPRSHHTAMIFAKSEPELDSYQQLWSERPLSVLCF